MTAIAQLKPRTERLAMAKHEVNFLELIQSFRRGALLTDGDQKLSELIEAIGNTMAGGDLTMKLKFKVNKAGQVEMDPQITIKKPTLALGTGIYFATESGTLSRRDPGQMDIEDEIERRRALDA
jgi:hypothetical protein